MRTVKFVYTVYNNNTAVDESAVVGIGGFYMFSKPARGYPGISPFATGHGQDMLGSIWSEVKGIGQQKDSHASHDASMWPRNTNSIVCFAGLAAITNA